MGDTGSSRQTSGLTLVHITTIPATLGFLRGQLGFMRERGFDIHVVANPGTALNQFAAEQMVEGHGIKMERRITPIQDLRALWRLCRLFRSIRPDIVHASTPKGGLLGVIAGRLMRVPLVVYQVRGLPFTGMRGAGRKLLMLTERAACAGAHRVLAVSHSLRDELLANKITPGDRVVVLASGSSNGVAAETRFNPANFTQANRQKFRSDAGIPAGATVVGFVGRLVRDKGVVELALAWTAIAAAYPSAWLLVVGDWEARDAVPSDIRSELEGHPRVRLTGEQADVARFYSIMDIVVLPTFREGFPNVPLEAAAMELPVIATQVTGCVDAVVADVTGTLIPAGDHAALAEALRAYLDKPDMRKRHGLAGRERVLRQFQPSIIWEATFDMYREWLGQLGVPLNKRRVT